MRYEVTVSSPTGAPPGHEPRFPGRCRSHSIPEHGRERRPTRHTSYCALSETLPVLTGFRASKPNARHCRYSRHVVWLMISALAVTALVAAAALPRRSSLGPTAGFPWFWVALPTTCIAVSASIGAFTLWPQAVTGAGSLWWDLSSPSTPAGQFLSSEQYHRITTWHRMSRILPVVSAAAALWCAWTWRGHRV